MLVVEQTTDNTVLAELFEKFGEDSFVVQKSSDGIPTLWLQANKLHEVLRFLKPEYSMLYDLFGIDERLRTNRRLPSTLIKQ
jgi:NADH-quinone oxidoreductase subunit C/D